MIDEQLQSSRPHTALADRLVEAVKYSSTSVETLLRIPYAKARKK
jgi:hypothetical protein